MIGGVPRVVRAPATAQRAPFVERSAVRWRITLRLLVCENSRQGTCTKLPGLLRLRRHRGSIALPEGRGASKWLSSGRT